MTKFTSLGSRSLLARLPDPLAFGKVGRGTWLPPSPSTYKARGTLSKSACSDQLKKVRFLYLV